MPERGLAASAGLKHPAGGQEPVGPAGHPHPVVGKGHLPRHPCQQHKPTGREGPHQAPHSRGLPGWTSQVTSASARWPACPPPVGPVSRGKRGTLILQFSFSGVVRLEAQVREGKGQGVLLPEGPVSQPLPCPAGKGQQDPMLRALERWGGLAQGCRIPGAGS